jgi:hypothetical protein
VLSPRDSRLPMSKFLEQRIESCGDLSAALSRPRELAPRSKVRVISKQARIRANIGVHTSLGSPLGCATNNVNGVFVGAGSVST